MITLMKKLARKMLTRPVAPTAATPITNRARLGFETFEDRVVPAVGGLSITSIVASGDLNPDPVKVTLTQGTTDSMTVNFTYTSSLSATATADLQNTTLDTPGTVTVGPATNGNGSVAITGLKNLGAGSYNLQLTLDDADPGKQTSTVGSALTIELSITVVPTTTTVVSVAGATTLDGETFTTTYDGNAHAATAVVTGDTGLSATITYQKWNGSGWDAATSDAPVNAGTYLVTATYAGDSGHSASSDTATIIIAKATASFAISNYSGTYDGQYHGLSGTATGVNGENLSSLLDLGAEVKDAGTYTVGWSFAGNENYEAASGSGTVSISAVSLGDFASAVTQGSINLSSNGTVSFAISIDANGIVDGQTVAQLFNGATFTLKMKNGTGGYETLQATAVATVVDNVVYITLNMKNPADVAFLTQGLDAGETSAAKASAEYITISGISIDGNYTLSEEAMTKIFKSGK